MNHCYRKVKNVTVSFSTWCSSKYQLNISRSFELIHSIFSSPFLYYLLKKNLNFSLQVRDFPAQEVFPGVHLVCFMKWDSFCSSPSAKFPDQHSSKCQEEKLSGASCGWTGSQKLCVRKCGSSAALQIQQRGGCYGKALLECIGHFRAPCSGSCPAALRLAIVACELG